MSSETPKKTNIWDFLSTTALAAINKGQAIPFFVFVLLFIVVLKAGASDVYKVIEGFGYFLLNLYALGWSLFVITALLWFAQSRKSRRIYDDEMDRVSDKKTLYQNQLNEKRDFKSSKNKKND